MTENENWKPVVGYEGYYEVSDHGNVRSVDRPVTDKFGRKYWRSGQEIKPRAGANEYLKVNLKVNGQASTRYVHRLVLEAFRGSCPPGHEACHWDDDPSSNRLDNLRWGTSSENNIDMVRNGNHINARKTHCPQGHEYTPENTYVYPNGSRNCRECRRAQKRAYRAQKKKREAYNQLTGMGTA